MALRDTKTAATTKPTFEDMDEGETTTVEKTTTAANTTPPAAANETAAETSAPASTSTEVATVKSSGLALSKNEASAFAKEVEALKGAADFSYGNYTVFKGNNGEIVSTGTEKQTSLGRWVKVTMIAWDDHFEISPNSKSEKSRDLVAYSKDGETVDRVIGEKYQGWAGKPVSEYLDFLQNEMDYPDAASRRFIDVGCAVHQAEGNDAFNGEIIQVTLSQSSIPSFSRYQEKLVQKARAIARGVPGVKVPEDPFTFYFLRELASANGNNWTKLEVLDRLPAKI